MIADMRKLPSWADLDAVLGQHPKRLEIELHLSLLVLQAQEQCQTAFVNRILGKDAAPLGSKGSLDDL